MFKNRENWLVNHFVFFRLSLERIRQKTKSVVFHAPSFSGNDIKTLILKHRAFKTIAKKERSALMWKKISASFCVFLVLFYFCR